jgi:hypothetical protein
MKRLVGAPGFEPGTSCAQGNARPDSIFFTFDDPFQNQADTQTTGMWPVVSDCPFLHQRSLHFSLQSVAFGPCTPLREYLLTPFVSENGGGY